MFPSLRYTHVQDVNEEIHSENDNLDLLSSTLMFQGVSRVSAIEGIAYIKSGIQRSCLHNHNIADLATADTTHHGVSNLLSCETMCVLKDSEQGRSCKGYTFMRNLQQCHLYSNVGDENYFYKEGSVSCVISKELSGIEKGVDFLAISKDITKRLGSALQNWGKPILSFSPNAEFNMGVTLSQEYPSKAKDISYTKFIAELPNQLSHNDIYNSHRSLFQFNKFFQISAAHNCLHATKTSAFTKIFSTSTNWTLNYYFRHASPGNDVALVVELIGNHSIELRTNITKPPWFTFSLEDANTCDSRSRLDRQHLCGTILH